MPFGALADRAGRARVFLFGHLALIGVYLVLRFSGLGLVAVLGCLFLLGTYYAATDGVLMALTGSRLHAGVRASGLAVVTTGIAVAQFGASILVGLGWERVGPEATVGSSSPSSR